MYFQFDYKKEAAKIAASFFVYTKLRLSTRPYKFGSVFR